MSYLVLARKFRPQTFGSVVGQEHISRALANAIVRNRVPHALLFTGPRGVGKTTTARVLARSLNCINRPKSEQLKGLSEAEAREKVEPCGECVNCQEIAKSMSVGVWEVDGASNNSVDNVRELIESLRTLPPPSSPYKVYIIDEVHMLSTAAFNALLKSLEEPPPNTIFVFATTEPQKIPETVLSRCQQHNFHRLPRAIIRTRLESIAEKEGIVVDSDVFDFLSRRADGGMRDAETLLERLTSLSAERVTLQDALEVFGAVDRSLLLSLVQAVIYGDTAQGLRLLDTAFSSSLDERAFLVDFLDIWRQCLLIGATTSGNLEALEAVLVLNASEIAEIRDVIVGQEVINLQRLFEVAERAVSSALSSHHPRFLLEAAVVKMSTLPTLRPLPEILKELHSLSKTSSAGQISSGQVRVSESVRPNSPQPVRPTQVMTEQGTEIKSSNKEVGEFNPSWEEFVHYVKSTLNEPVLVAFLRRVRPVLFQSGRLEIAARAFDLSSLKEPETQKTLRRCLEEYSRVSRWDLKFIEEKNQIGEGSIDSSAAAGKRESNRSLVEIEAIAEQERIKQLEEQARNDPLVQSALSTFSGSRIERVSVAKRS